MVENEEYVGVNWEEGDDEREGEEEGGNEEDPARNPAGDGVSK